MCVCVCVYVYVMSETNGSLHWATAAEAAIAAAALDCGLFIDKLVDTFLYSC